MRVSKQYARILITAIALGLAGCGGNQFGVNAALKSSESNSGTKSPDSGSDSNTDPDPNPNPNPDPNNPGGDPVPTPTPTPTPVPKPPSTPTPVPRAGDLFNVTFDDWAVGSTYTLDKAKSDFGNVPSVANPGMAKIVASDRSGGGKALQLLYRKGVIGGGSSLAFESRLPKTYDELYYSFRIKFSSDFNFVKGGKLTGICGGACNTGGQTPSGYDGWSARLMWTRISGIMGVLDQYVYHSGQPTQYGDDLYFNSGGYKSFTAGKWYRVEWRVKMNTPGQSNGIIQSWVDGVKSVDKQTIVYRRSNAFAIDKFIFSTFFGGGDSSWAPTKDEYIYWDDFVLSTSPISH